MNKNLYLIYWSSPEKERNTEVLDTIKKNIESGFFTDIYIFADKNSEKDLNFSHKNIKVIQREQTTYQDVFDYSNQICSSGEFVNILANSDIFFDFSILHANNIPETDFYCLTRYEEDGLRHKHDDPYKGSDSQDVWIWKNKCKIKNANFSLGFIGCDNKIAYFAHAHGYDVKNPSITIKTHHKHSVNVRPGTSSSQKLRLDPPYKLIFPTSMDYSMRFVTFLNFGCLEICKNMLESAKKIGIPLESFMIYCLDDKSYEQLNSYVPCVRYEVGAPSAYKNWSFDPNGEFRQVVKHKWKIIKEVYKNHKSLCWVDTDIVFLKDVRILNNSSDKVLCQSDLPGSLICSGFMIFSDNPNSENLINECANLIDEDDQLAINNFYTEDKIQLLSLDLFPNGHVYYKQNLKSKEAFIVHNNHMVGINTKIEHFKREGLWFI